MKLRQYRGGFQKSMETVIKIEPTREEFLNLSKPMVTP